MAQNLVESLRLVLVTDDTLVAGRDLVALCLAAERGGVSSIQLRLKRASARDLADAARALLGALYVPLFVNDRLDVALVSGAAGVHLGPDDLSVDLARKMAPPGFWIGASVGSAEEARGASHADYWGVGPLRSTNTKPDAGNPLGLAGARPLIALAPAGIPTVLIGGVLPSDAEPASRAGFAGLAVSSGILARPDVAAAAAEYGRLGTRQ